MDKLANRRYYLKNDYDYNWTACDKDLFISSNKQTGYTDIYNKDEHYSLNFDIDKLSELGFTFGESMRNGGEFDQLTYGIQCGNLTYLEYDPDNSCFCIVGECYQSPNLLWNLRTFDEVKTLVELITL